MLRAAWRFVPFTAIRISGAAGEQLATEREIEEDDLLFTKPAISFDPAAACGGGEGRDFQAISPQAATTSKAKMRAVEFPPVTGSSRNHNANICRLGRGGSTPSRRAMRESEKERHDNLNSRTYKSAHY